MSKIVVTGAGMVGLTAAMLLAKDGHEVTVVERDPASAPSPDEAWGAWERRGVNQFRMLHYLQPRWRQVVETELPELAVALQQAGAARYNPLELIPTEIFGPAQDDDDACAALTARRPVAEAATSSAASAMRGLTIRRGVAVAGLVEGTPTAPGVPHVTGLVTESGDVIPADFVVDATGRRSPLLSC